MTLREKQTLFLSLISRLIRFAEANGLALTMADGYIPPHLAVQAGHKPNGNHPKRLALDLNLFVKGVWKKFWCPEWDVLGHFWKSLHPLCAWGGDFSNKDYNHFSLEHEGMK